MVVDCLFSLFCGILCTKHINKLLVPCSRYLFILSALVTGIKLDNFDVVGLVKMLMLVYTEKQNIEILAPEITG